MKREILFRALRADGKGWVYGDLIQWKSKGICAITPQDGNEWSNCYDFEVIPETVGQFTGLLDKNGTKIFEGDFLDIKYYYEHEIMPSFVYNKILIEYVDSLNNQFVFYCSLRFLCRRIYILSFP